MVDSLVEQGRIFAEIKGEAKGIEKGKVETARNLKRIGVATETIVQATILAGSGENGRSEDGFLLDDGNG